MTVDEGLLDYMREHSGACRIQLRGVGDVDLARRGLGQAQHAIWSIPHPDEPTGSLLEFSSGIGDTGTGPQFSFAAGDAEVYDGALEEVIEVIVQALHDSGVETGVLTTPEPGDEANDTCAITPERTAE